MSEELTFEQMLEGSLKTIHTGEVVEGTVINVKPEEIILNIGYKSDGILTKYEYTNDNSVDLTAAVQVGDTLEVKVEVDERYFDDEMRGLENLSKKIAATLKMALGLAVKVTLVEPMTLPRFEGKAVHVIDNRKYD